MNSPEKQLEPYGLCTLQDAADIIGVTRRTLDKWQVEEKVVFKNKISLGRGPTCQILLDLKEVKKVAKEYGL